MRLLSIILVFALALTGCNAAASPSSYSGASSTSNDDTVLWVNPDGTDCDTDDLLEGDKDCKPQKKKVAKTPKPTIKPKATPKPTPKVTKPTKPKKQKKTKVAKSKNKR